MGKIRVMFRNGKRKVVMFGTVTAVFLGQMVHGFCGTETPTSLLDPGVKTVVEDFAADLKPTVLALVGIIVPAGLAMWAIGLGVKKGLAILKRNASKAI